MREFSAVRRCSSRIRGHRSRAAVILRPPAQQMPHARKKRTKHEQELFYHPLARQTYCIDGTLLSVRLDATEAFTSRTNAIQGARAP